MIRVCVAKIKQLYHTSTNWYDFFVMLYNITTTSTWSRQKKRILNTEPSLY